MSSILGVISSNNRDFFKVSSKIIKSEVLSFKSDFIQFCVSGTKRNIYYSKENKWLVAGIGLTNDSEKAKILNQNDWENLFKQKHFEKKLKQLNGHFIVIVWSNGKVSFYSDVLGLREISLLKTKNGIFFSTNATWLSKFNELELDFYEFGSRWMLFNQISDKSIFKNVIRIVRGKKASVSLATNNITVSDYNWMPSETNNQMTIDEFSSKLSSFINLRIPESHNISLSLSGGMDSRLLLSYLLKKNILFDTHTFGNPNHPDSILAKKLANRFNLKHEQINLGLPEKDQIIKDISEYSSLTLVNNAASAVLQLQNYWYLSDRKIVIIDGGFGEIWRRELFYNLFLRGKDVLLNREIKKIIPFLKAYRADIFNSNFVEKMTKGIEAQLEDLLSMLPEIRKVGLENWIDLFAIKTKLTNYISHEQARLDNKLTSIMPFIQPEILKELYNMPINLRKNGRLFRKIINSNCYNLKKVPLVKGLSVYPYFMNSLQSRLWSLAQNKMGLISYTDNNPFDLLNHLKEFIYDTINSRNVIETEFYDITKIRKIVDGYYEGNVNYNNELDWWLSFELFRQELKNE